MNPLGGGLIPQNPDLFAFLKSREDETVSQAALRFLFSHPRISTVLVGFSDAAQLREAVAAVERFTPMSADEIDGGQEGDRGAIHRPVHRLRLLRRLPAGNPRSRG